MTVPDDVFSCCCDWGFEIVKGQGLSPYVFFSGSQTWTAPGGSSVTSTIIRRRQSGLNDPFTVDWSGTGGTLQGGRAGCDCDGQFIYLNEGLDGVAKRDFDTNLIWQYDGGLSFSGRLRVAPNGEVLTGIGAPVQLAKISSTGTLLWTRNGEEILDDAGISYNPGPQHGGLELDLDGNAYTAVRDGSGRTVWLTKLDSDGNTIWAVQVFTLSSFSGATINDIAVDGDGNSYIVGRPSNSTAGDNIFSYDPDGNIRWSRLYEDNYTQVSSPQTICLDFNGDIIVGGRKLSGGNDIWSIKKILKDDVNNDAWVFPLTTYLWANEIRTNRDNEIFLACNRSDSGANNFPCQIHLSPEGVQLDAGSGTENTASTSCAVVPGRYPHFAP